MLWGRGAQAACAPHAPSAAASARRHASWRKRAQQAAAHHIVHGVPLVLPGVPGHALHPAAAAAGRRGVGGGRMHRIRATRRGRGRGVKGRLPRAGARATPHCPAGCAGCHGHARPMGARQARGGPHRRGHAGASTGATARAVGPRSAMMSWESRGSRPLRQRTPKSDPRGSRLPGPAPAPVAGARLASLPAPADRTAAAQPQKPIPVLAVQAAP